MQNDDQKVSQSKRLNGGCRNGNNQIKIQVQNVCSLKERFTQIRSLVSAFFLVLLSSLTGC